MDGGAFVTVIRCNWRIAARLPTSSHVGIGYDGMPLLSLEPIPSRPGGGSIACKTLCSNCCSSLIERCSVDIVEAHDRDGTTDTPKFWHWRSAAGVFTVPFSLFLDHFLRFCLFGEAQGGVSAIFPSISLKHCEPFYPFPSKAKWESILTTASTSFYCFRSHRQSERVSVFLKKLGTGGFVLQKKIEPRVISFRPIAALWRRESCLSGWRNI